MRLLSKHCCYFSALFRCNNFQLLNPGSVEGCPIYQKEWPANTHQYLDLNGLGL